MNCLTGVLPSSDAEQRTKDHSEGHNDDHSAESAQSAMAGGQSDDCFFTFCCLHFAISVTQAYCFYFIGAANTLP